MCHIACIETCCAQLLQLCLTLCHPVDCRPPGSSVHGNLLARILEWVPMPTSRGSSHPATEPASPKFPALQADSLPPEPSGKPRNLLRSDLSLEWNLFLNSWSGLPNSISFNQIMSNLELSRCQIKRKTEHI